MKTKKIVVALVLTLFTSFYYFSYGRDKEEIYLSSSKHVTVENSTRYNTMDVDGVEIFYREAGDKNKPTLVLLHGYPTSSHMFRNLIKDLSADYHLIAPDYPGFGRSEQPKTADFDYTFENVANLMDQFLIQMKLEKYSLYLMDYGAPIGYRIFSKHPKKVVSFIVQNGNAYDEGLGKPFGALKAYWKDKSPENRKALEGFHSIDGLKWQYTVGVSDPSTISPDNWQLDLQHLAREENNEIQLAMFYDYRTNVELYPQWHKKFRKYQPPTLIVWGKNDPIFPASGAQAYKKDLNNVEIHLLDSGHFALEDKGSEISNIITKFLIKNKIK